MTSTFGWLDTDESRRDAMLRIVELFKEEGTVDDLGIGSIRDVISNALFPGTSVLHTRLRYVLFVPWLLQDAATARTLEGMKADFRRREIQLITSLLNGGETTGVIGGRARAALKRTPSAAYWAALQRYGMRRWDTSVDGFFRRAMTRRTLGRSAVEPDDPGAGERTDTGLDPNLPLAPTDLLKAATFDITDEERRYLGDRLTMTTTGSLLAWLVEHAQPEEVDYVWELDTAPLPEHLKDLIEQARLFREVIRGAPILYNLMLAEKRNHPDWIADYADRLSEWHDRVADRSLADWDSRSFWLTLRRVGGEIRPLTRAFVESWVAETRTGGGLGARATARTLIANRERYLKSGRARLMNQAALDRWQGASGLLALDYRWRVTRTLLADLQVPGPT